MATQSKLTAEGARSFHRFSPGNAMIVAAARPCGCKPYEDVFTFRRWLAQGFVVQRGQKAIKLPVIVDEEREEDGEIKPSRRFVTGAVFCRCQVVTR